MDTIEIREKLEEVVPVKKNIKQKPVSNGYVSVVQDVMNEAEKEKEAERQDETEEPNPSLVMVKEIVNMLRDTDDIDISTEFKRSQVLLFQQVELFADYFNIDILKKFCEGIKRKNLSIDRGLRKELVEAIKQINSPIGDLTDMGKDKFPFSMGSNLKF